MVTTWIRCPGCGRRSLLPLVLCARCRELIPGTVRRDLDAAQDNPGLLPMVLVAVLNAVAVRVDPHRPGRRPA